MESSFLTTVFLPLALFIIMLGMGLTLTAEDFKRVIVYPKAVVVGLVAQLVMLPVVGFGVVSLFSLKPELAVGVMILAACPGGATSNIITFLAKGDVALSVSLTAVSSFITVFTIPVVVNFSIQSFMGSASSLNLSLIQTIVQIAVMTLLPVGLGMLTLRYSPLLAKNIEKFVKWLSLFFLGAVIAGLLLREKENFLGYVVDVGWVTLVLNLVSMALGWTMAILTKLSLGQATTITIEVGVQNAALAIAIAATLLKNPTMGIPASIYGLLMFVTAGGFAWLTNKQLTSSKVENQ